MARLATSRVIDRGSSRTIDPELSRPGAGLLPTTGKIGSDGLAARPSASSQTVRHDRRASTAEPPKSIDQRRENWFAQVVDIGPFCVARRRRDDKVKLEEGGARVRTQATQIGDDRVLPGLLARGGERGWLARDKSVNSASGMDLTN
jgi:hypothetical protein